MTGNADGGKRIPLHRPSNWDNTNETGPWRICDDVVMCFVFCIYGFSYRGIL